MKKAGTDTGLFLCSAFEFLPRFMMNTPRQISAVLADYICKLQSFTKTQGISFTKQPEQAIPAGLVFDYWFTGLNTHLFIPTCF